MSEDLIVKRCLLLPECLYFQALPSNETTEVPLRFRREVQTGKEWKGETELACFLKLVFVFSFTWQEEKICSAPVTATLKNKTSKYIYISDFHYFKIQF